MLDGDLAAAARAAVREIADHIDDVEPADRNPPDVALFWAYAAGAFDDEASGARYDAAVQALGEHLQRGFGSASLYGGLAGTGWVLAHISDGASELLDELDEQLLAELEASPWRGDYDLIRGRVGLGVYFLERLRSGAPAAGRGIQWVVDGLARPAPTA